MVRLTWSLLSTFTPADLHQCRLGHFMQMRNKSKNEILTFGILTWSPLKEMQKNMKQRDGVFPTKKASVCVFICATRKKNLCPSLKILTLWPDVVEFAYDPNNLGD